MICRKCGSELPDDVMFCVDCGTRVTLGDAADNAKHQDPAADETATREADEPDSATSDGTKQEAGTLGLSVRDVALEVSGGHAKQAPDADASQSAGNGDDEAMKQRAHSTSSQVLSWKHLAVIAGIAAVFVAAASVYFAMFAPYSIDARRFPDEAVCNALSAQADTDGDGKLSREEADLAQSIDLSGTEVSSLEGMEVLTGLKSLDVSDTQLSSLDVSAYDALEALDVSGCASLSQLELGGISGLKNLDVSATALPALDVSAQQNLRELNVQESAISTLDLSGNAELTSLAAADSVAVTGLEATQVRAQFQPVEYHRVNTDGLGSQELSNSLKSFTYDEQNRLVQIVTSNADSRTGEFVGDPVTETFEYDKDGRCVKRIVEGDGGQETTISYDDQGRMETAQVNDVTLTMEYDSQGKLIKVNSQIGDSSADAQAQTYTSYSYDEEGRVVSTETPASSSRSTGYLYEYDKKGNLVRIDFRSQTNTRKTVGEFTYDDEGRCVKLVIHGISGEADDETYECLFSYDEAGNLMTSDKVELIYDADGNLVRRDFLGGEVGEGATEITYRRVFTAKDAPDVMDPLQIGNPYATSLMVYPYTINLSASSDPVASYYGPYPLDSLSLS